MNKEEIIKELQFKAVRSSGAGGQHVNKVATKIELIFYVTTSLSLSDNEKERIYTKLSHRLTKENVLLLQCDESRSQHRNKDFAIKRFLAIVESALKVSKVRRKTKPKRAAVEKRLKGKLKNSLKKASRGKPNLE